MWGAFFQGRETHGVHAANVQTNPYQHNGILILHVHSTVGVLSMHASAENHMASSFGSEFQNNDRRHAQVYAGIVHVLFVPTLSLLVKQPRENQGMTILNKSIALISASSGQTDLQAGNFCSNYGAFPLPSSRCLKDRFLSTFPTETSGANRRNR